MIYKKIFLMVFMMMTLNVHAQQRRQADPEQRRENVEAMKIAFITRELNLTSEEAKSFWPVYNEYAAETRKIREARRERLKDAKTAFDAMSDKEVEKLIETEMASRQQELDLQKQYHAKFRNVLPVRKVALLYRAEEGFKRELLDKIKERQEQGNPGRR